MRVEFGMRNAECGVSRSIPHSAFRTPHSLTWLRAGLLATLLMLASAISAFAAEPAKSELKWRRPNVSVSAKNPLRDRAVRTVAHEEDAGPVLRIADRSSSGFHSVVTPAEEPAESVYTAQERGDQPPNGLEREIERPFELPPMDEPAPPEPMDEPEAEPMPLPREPSVERPAEQPSVPREFPAAPPTDRRDPFERNEIEPRLPEPAPDSPTSVAEERAKAEQNCQDELDRLRASTLARINLQIDVTGTPGQDFPFECTVDDGAPFEPRCWTEVIYMWKASALCHKPLYFECEQMERYGHSWGPVADPLIAGAHFFTRLPVLPYCMGITPPNECIYALGHYRVGSCAPYMIDPIPFTWRAAFNQAAFTVGMVYFLP